jgi:hypothetical protein
MVMNDVPNEPQTATETGSLDTEELRAVRAAQDRARKLRDKAIAREQARLRAVMAALDVTPEELLGLPARKRRSRSKPETE